MNRVTDAELALLRQADPAIEEICLGLEETLRYLAGNPECPTLADVYNAGLLSSRRPDLVGRMQAGTLTLDQAWVLAMADS